MLKRVLILSSSAVLLLSSCGSKVTTAQLAEELGSQMEQLPSLVASVNDANSAQLAAQKIEALRLEVRKINVQVKPGQYLGSKERGDLEKRLRAVRGEVEFLLKNLRGKPELMLIITEPLADLGAELEQSRVRMKADTKSSQ